MKWLVRRAMTALYPRTEELVGIEDVGIDEFLDRFRDEAPPIMWLGVVAGSAVFTLSPAITVKRPVPAFLLSDELLERHVEEITYHPIYLVRQSVFLVKFAAGLCWGADEKVRDSFSLSSYPPDPSTWRMG